MSCFFHTSQSTSSIPLIPLVKINLYKKLLLTYELTVFNHKWIPENDWLSRIPNCKNPDLVALVVVLAKYLMTATWHKLAMRCVRPSACWQNCNTPWRLLTPSLGVLARYDSMTLAVAWIEFGCWAEYIALSNRGSISSFPNGSVRTILTAPSWIPSVGRISLHQDGGIFCPSLTSLQSSFLLVPVIRPRSCPLWMPKTSSSWIFSNGPGSLSMLFSTNCVDPSGCAR